MTNISTLTHFLAYSTYQESRTTLAEHQHYTWVVEMIGSWGNEILQQIIAKEKESPRDADAIGAACAAGLTRLIAELKQDKANENIIGMLDGILSILIRVTLEIKA